MDLTKEALQFIQSTAGVEGFEYDGLQYISKPFHLVTPPTIAAAVETKTLTALVSLYQANFENIKSLNPVFHVESEDRVTVYTNLSDKYGRRSQIAVAELDEKTIFPFGQFMSQEQFIIGLQAQFLDYADRDYVLKVVSNLASEDKLQIEDNGVAQTATAKTGTVLVDAVLIKPRVLLRPFRTFREATQPPSEFIMRVRKQNGVPHVALFEADGGAWKLEAMSEVADYLTNKLLGVTVIF